MQTPLQKIRELRALLDEGLLSEEEFCQRKNAILDHDLAPEDKYKVSSPDLHLSQGTDLGFSLGQEVGPRARPYRLEHLLGQGGMGQVWKATDLATQAELGHSEIVALKILPPELTRSALHARLLVEETSLVRKLAHENIVRVYEWAQDSATGSYFIIMEYLDGHDLDSYLAQQGQCSLQQVLALLHPVAQALRYAWEKHSLVHRDLKPSNLFLTQQGHIKLLDFGISARLRSSTKGSAANTSSLRKASTRLPSAGTDGYRAPEAGTHQHVFSPSLDVYAVSIMIYQMLEGAMPFNTDRGYAIRHRYEQMAVCPLALNAAQWQVLQSGLAVDPAQRPQSVAELLDAIQGRRTTSVATPISPTLSASKQRQIAEENTASQIELATRLRAEQRRQRKLLEEQRRQQASIALRTLMERQRTLSEAEKSAAESRQRDKKVQLRAQQIVSVQSAQTSAKKPDPYPTVRVSWEEAQRYLASMSQPGTPPIVWDDDTELPPATRIGTPRAKR